MKERSDQKWVRLLRAENKQATDDLWILIFAHSINIARGYCGGDEMRAQDIGHEAAMKAFRRVTKRGVYNFAFKGPFLGYCRRIALNEVKRLLSQQRKVLVTLSEELEAKSFSRNPSEIMRLLEPCLEQLTSRQRAVTELIYLQQLSHEEAAKKLSITRNNLYKTKHSILSKLQRCMEGRGFTHSGEVW